MAKEKLQIEVVNDQDTKQIVNVSNSISDFELNAKITAGTLTSNAKELKAKIESELKNYSVEKYILNPGAAKSDKALLNKVKDAVSDKRKEIMKAWNVPLDEFLSEMKSLETSITDASNKINDIVKEAENKEKAEKRAWIENYWSTLDFHLVSLDKIFNQKWLNKTYKNEQIMLDCEAITERITTELKTINSMADEDREILASFYLDTLDLNATLQKGNQLKENREKLKAEKTVKALENAKLIPPEGEVIKPAKVLVDYKDNSKAACNPYQSNKVAVNTTNEMSFTLKLYGTKEQLLGLRKYIDSNGIKYEKI